MAWFEFWDMHSGGHQKLEIGLIYIEAEDEGKAEERFAQRWARPSQHITCECCGPDYWLSESAPPWEKLIPGRVEMVKARQGGVAILFAEEGR